MSWASAAAAEPDKKTKGGVRGSRRQEEHLEVSSMVSNLLSKKKQKRPPAGHNSKPKKSSLDRPDKVTGLHWAVVERPYHATDARTRTGGSFSDPAGVGHVPRSNGDFQSWPSQLLPLPSTHERGPCVCLRYRPLTDMIAPRSAQQGAEGVAGPGCRYWSGRCLQAQSLSGPIRG